MTKRLVFLLVLLNFGWILVLSIQSQEFVPSLDSVVKITFTNSDSLVVQKIEYQYDQWNTKVGEYELTWDSYNQKFLETQSIVWVYNQENQISEVIVTRLDHFGATGGPESKKYERVYDIFGNLRVETEYGKFSTPNSPWIQWNKTESEYNDAGKVAMKYYYGWIWNGSENSWKIKKKEEYSYNDCQLLTVRKSYWPDENDNWHSDRFHEQVYVYDADCQLNSLKYSVFDLDVFYNYWFEFCIPASDSIVELFK